MRKEFVTYEIASKLKELGLTVDFLGEYRNYKDENYLQIYHEIDSCSCDDMDYVYTKLCGAPLWQQAIEWLFDNYKIKVDYTLGHDNKFAPKLMDYKNRREHIFDYDIKSLCNSRYDVIELSILKAIELCQTN